MKLKLMHTTSRNKDYAVVSVSKEIMIDDSKITSCPKMLGSKTSARRESSKNEI
ncbi:hypothetical protein [Clostridium beijerinckii]|uniref:hypothetical protein n=1 Tax=Clostridium beijerinckii TaxID=1520 RepID=UPI0022E0645B|nr:hypothetical protein [Clostridium beijerinckii]